MIKLKDTAGVAFQFALPRGERRKSGRNQHNVVLFQFALPRGERRPQPLRLLPDIGFQFALPRGERQANGSLSKVSLCFNSRSREGSDAWMVLAFFAASSFQFALPRGERRTSRLSFSAIQKVSIRAPARGATPAATCLSFLNCGFNSRSREGSDPACTPAIAAVTGFNSRSREGSDCHHRMAGTVWHKSASCASLPARYRGINGILYTIWKIIILFNLLALSLISRHFAENRWLALNNQGITEYVRCGFGAIMLNFIASFTTEHIKAQAVGFRLISLQQFAFKARPLFRIYITFKNGILHAHAIILAVRGYLPQAFRATCVSKGNIVGN